MNRSRLFSAFAALAIIVAHAIGEEVSFPLRMVSEGGGDWGVATRTYSGSLKIGENRTTVEITNVFHAIELKNGIHEHPGDKLSAFSCSIDYRQEGRVVILRLVNGLSGDSRVDQIAYMAAYLVSENVVRPFMFPESALTNAVPGDCGMIIQKRPAYVQMKGVGEGRGSGIHDSVISLRRFVKTPRESESNNGSGINLVGSSINMDGIETSIRQFKHGDVFPVKTILMHGSPKPEQGSDSDLLLADAFAPMLSNLFSSYHRVTITLGNN